MKKIPKVSVIIVNWNRKDDTLETVRSLAKSKIPGFILEIYVIDNGSTDGSQEAVIKLFEIEVPGKILTKITKLKENLGFTGGNNIGMKDALSRDFDYVALLNNDTLVDENLVGNLIKEHDKNPKAGAISPKVYFERGFEFHKERYKKDELGKVFWYAGGILDWKNVYGSNRGVDEVDTGQFDEVTDTDFATGCFVMYKAQALKEVGLYDNRYFAYMEDADHAQRLKKAGWKVLYTPNAKLWHKVSQSSGIGSGLNDYYLTRNRMLFGLKYAPLWTKQALIRESVRLLFTGRKWQKIGIRDYYLGRFGRGSWR